MSRDDDRTWAELIDSFNAPPAADAPQQAWPDAENIDPDEDVDELDDLSGGDRGTSITLTSVDDTGRPDLLTGPPPGGTDDHFVPPTPPPLPRGDIVGRLAWYGLIGGPLLLVVAAVLSWTSDELLLLAAGAFVGGFVTLIARLRGHRPNDPDNGAVV